MPDATADATDSSGSDGNAYRIVLLALRVTVVCTLPMFLTGALAVQMRAELNFGVAALGLAVAVFRAAGAILAAPLGRFADRVGPGPSMRVATLIAAFAGFGIAVLARNWAILCLFLAVGGSANVLGQSAANLSLSRAVRVERQGIAFGMKQSALPAGTMIAGLTVPVLALTVGWRWAFALAATGGVVVAALVPRGVDARFAAPPGVSNRVRKRRSVVLLVVSLFFAMCAASTLSAFTVDGAVSAGLSPAMAGLLLTLGSACAITVRLVAGFQADRRGRGHLGAAGKMVIVGALGYALLGMTNPWGFGLGTMIAFGMGWGFNGLYWLAIVRMNRATPGRATGTAMTAGLLGGLVGPTVFGLLVEAFGYPVAWFTAAVSACVGGVLMLAARRVLARDREQGPTITD